MLHPPVPLLGLAALLRQRYANLVEVSVLDVAVAGYSGMQEELVRRQPHLVGLRSLSHTHHQFHHAASLVKDYDPTCFVVGGGLYANTSPRRVLADKNLAALCTNEGETVLPALVGKWLENALPEGLSSVAGLHYRDGGGTVRTNPPAPWLEDLDTLPFPDYGELDLSPYSSRHAATCVLRPYGVILTSRGCPYRCIYCHNIFGTKVRYRSAANVASELQSLHQRHGLSDFLFCDDMFNFNLLQAKATLRAVAELPFRSRLYFPNGLRGDRWDEEFLDLLAAAGTVEVVFAIEAASPRIQKLMRKHLDLPSVRRAIERTGARGIMVNAFYMVGFPGETQEEIEETLTVLRSLREQVHFPFLQIVRAWDGSELGALARAQGFNPEFLADHAMMPYGFQEAFLSQHNFLPAEQLRRIRSRVTLDFLDPERLRRLLPFQRRLFTEDELLLKYGTYLGTDRTLTAALLERATP